MNNFYVLDIETSSKVDKYLYTGGLEPWRLRHGTVQIDSIALFKPDETVVQIENDGSSDWALRVKSLLEECQGQVVWAHNAIFDVAWLIAQLSPNRTDPIHQLVKGITWRCSQLLFKWLCNGQLADDSRFSYSLVNLVKTFLPHHANTAEFIDIKSKPFVPGQNKDYWLNRGELDVIMTAEIVKFGLGKVPESMRAGLITEWSCIVPVANSWIMGIRVDRKKLDLLQPVYANKRQTLADALCIPVSALTSPKQIGELVFGRWGLTAKEKTSAGKPSTAKEALMWLQYDLLQKGDLHRAELLGTLLEARSISTLESKYVKTMYEALDHTTDGYIYGCPRIFGTYTGRFTYSNKTQDEKTGIALHQIPRTAMEIRELLLPPEGYAVYEADAAGQESRLMAIRSGDPLMTEVFQKGLNFHSMTGSSIIGMDYYEFEAGRKLEDGQGNLTEKRQLGKLTNLACNFRIGGKALSEKSFTQHDMYMPVETGMFLVNTFKRTYRGVPEYWDDVIRISQRDGFVEVFGGRRYKLNKWQTDRWMTESSAINVPIQGAGASMKEIAIVETYNKNPDALFSLDLHDASFFYVKEDDVTRVAAEIDDTLNGIDYKPYWGFTPSVPLPYESKFGINFSEVK